MSINGNPIGRGYLGGFTATSKTSTWQEIAAVLVGIPLLIAALVVGLTMKALGKKP